MITLEIEFDKVKGKRCYLKCVITDLSKYDLIISYRDHVYLGLQDWLIEGKPLPTLEQGETPPRRRGGGGALGRRGGASVAQASTAAAAAAAAVATPEEAE